jgi:nicotinamidase-related amidase
VAVNGSGLVQARDCRLLVVDCQVRLVPHVRDGAAVVAGARHLVGAARVLGIPVLLSEHYPEGLGPTVSALRADAGDAEVLRKDHFSCVAEPAIRARLLAGSRRTLVLAGMEAHVCVLQTALDALAAGLRVLLVADVAGSRRAPDLELALARMREAGVTLVSREMMIFEWARRGGTDVFRELHRRFLRDAPELGESR